MDVFTVLDILYYSTFGLSLILNTTLILLIVYRTNNNLKPYSRILLQGVIVDIVMSTFLALVPFRFESVQGYIFMGNVVPWLSQFQGYFKCVWWVPHAIFPVVTSFSGTIRSFYRYSNFCLTRTLTPKISACIYAFVFVIMFSITCVLTLTFVYIYDYPEGVSAITQLPFWIEHQQHLQLFCVGKLFHFSTLTYLAIVSSITTSSIGMLTWFNIRVAAHLREAKAHMHEKTIRLQQQITWQLSLQSIFPAFCSTQTFAFVLIIVFTPHYSGGMFMFFYAPYAMLPVLNPLTTLLCISQYRRQLCQMAGLTRFAVSSGVVTPSNKAPSLIASGTKKSIIASK